MATRNPNFKLVVPAIASLPLDIFINHIIVKLPSRSVIRCRSVCKQWLRLLTDPYFISIHFNHHNSINNRNILCGPIDYKDLPGDSKEDYSKNARAFHGRFCSLHIKSSSGAADLVRLPGFPNLHKKYIILPPICYCNGLVCILLSNYLIKRHFILIGNPSTGDYKILPEPAPLTRHRFGGGRWFFGFCYDSSIDDYKCVLIDAKADTRNPHIFILKSNSWRTNLGSSYNGKIGSDLFYQGVALDRSIYWLERGSNIIIEFDLDNEEFIELPLPLPSYIPKNQLLITVLGGSLCVSNCCKEKEEVDMWLMSKDKENKCCSWSHLMKVNIKFDFRYFEIRPLCFMKDGKILCHRKRLEYSLGEKLFILLDPKTKSVEDFIIQDETAGEWLEQFFFQTQIAYTDSLVSPN